MYIINDQIVLKLYKICVLIRCISKSFFYSFAFLTVVLFYSYYAVKSFFEAALE